MDNNMEYLKAQLAAAQARVAGMTAENMQREALGQSMAYTYADFDSEAQYMMTLSEAMR